ncbi:hypothetical protein NKH54_22560 [Mesorhizobium sp. M1004]|uniref:hypothetical protein n=1 Tax=Mesorhizobium sp. M1004 TaxID=2957046 RepID=UPI0033399715
MAGTAEDPVRIGPFARIISVHWDVLTHLCFYVTVSAAFQDNTSPVPLPPIPPTPDRPTIPDADWQLAWYDVPSDHFAGVQYVGTFTLALDYVGGSQPHDARVRRSSGHGGWVGVDTAKVEIPGGLPDMADTLTWGAQDKLVNPFYGTPSQGWQMTPGGAGDGKHVPDQPSLSFDSDPSPTLRLALNAVYTESPYWASGPHLSISFGANTSAADEIVDKTFGGSGLVATYQNKTFHAVATALDEPNGRLWVLCERSPSDDPS